MQKAKRATKIIATIGVRAEDPAHLKDLLLAGVDVVRVNAAHCKPGDIEKKVRIVRQLEIEIGRPVGVLLDLGGPKIRIGPLEGGETEWHDGESVEILPGSVKGSERRVSVTYPALLSDVKPGDEIRISDGKLSVRIDGVLNGALRGKVLTGGKFRSGAGVNFPNSALSAPALTSKDRRDLDEGLEAGIDFVGLSFVRTPQHVLDLRKRLEKVPVLNRPWIVSKIERPEAVKNVVAIAEVSDVLMVARGDLGVEIGLPSVPRVQREILALGHRMAVPVIVATQMLESMIESPVPTRAEVSDVAFAVHDGADAVMLSGETAIGSHPIEAVRNMAAIAETAEIYTSPELKRAADPEPVDHVSVVANAACLAAEQVKASMIVVYTATGRTAKLVSKHPSTIPVLALTYRQEVRRRMTILRDVVSASITETESVEERLREGDTILHSLRELAGSTIVEVSGTSLSEGLTNMIRIRTLERGARVRKRGTDSKT